MEHIAKVGIDVSKDTLDVYIERDGLRTMSLPNDAAGVARLALELSKFPCTAAMEASGRYELLARRALEESGCRVVVQNPRQVRRLADGLGANAKTDRLDARLLARTAALCAPNAPKSADREALADVSRLIQRLKLERSGHLKRLQTPGLCQAAALCLARLAEMLAAEIGALERGFERECAQTALWERFKIAQTVPGVGPTLARIAVCELPEDLGAWSVRQLSSYAGVAPMDDSSGSRKGCPRVPRHKNARLKAGLYMPAMSLVKSDPKAREVYARLRANARTHQQAIVAVMHKLLIRMVCVMKRGTPWEAEPPQKP